MPDLRFYIHQSVKKMWLTEITIGLFYHDQLVFLKDEHSMDMDQP